VREFVRWEDAREIGCSDVAERQVRCAVEDIAKGNFARRRAETDLDVVVAHKMAELFVQIFPEQVRSCDARRERTRAVQARKRARGQRNGPFGAIFYTQFGIGEQPRCARREIGACTIGQVCGERGAQRIGSTRIFGCETVNDLGHGQE